MSTAGVNAKVFFVDGSLALFAPPSELASASPTTLDRFFLPPEGRSEDGLTPNACLVASIAFQLPESALVGLPKGSSAGAVVASWTDKKGLGTPEIGVAIGTGAVLFAVVVLIGVNAIDGLGVAPAAPAAAVVTGVIFEESMTPPSDAPGGGAAAASSVYILASTGDTCSFDFRIFSSIESSVSKIRLAVSVVDFNGDGKGTGPLAAGVAPACAREGSVTASSSSIRRLYRAMCE